MNDRNEDLSMLAKGRMLVRQREVVERDAQGRPTKLRNYTRKNPDRAKRKAGKVAREATRKARILAEIERRKAMASEDQGGLRCS